MSDAQRQLLGILAEWDAMPDDYQIIIERRQGGGWDVALKQPSANKYSRGTGATFDEAWNNMRPHFQP
jgi:hypothetical protein